MAVGETRKIDLGYATVSLPAWVLGDPVQVGAGGFVGIGETRKYSVVFFPPVIDDERALLSQLEVLKGKPPDSVFAEELLALAQQPFSVWAIPKLGRRETAYRLTLLMTKYLTVGVATSVSILERGELGILVKTVYAGETLLEIHQLKKGSVQLVLIALKDPRAPEIVSAIAASYDLHPDGKSPDSIRRQIEQTHIPPAPPDVPAAGPPHPLTQ